MQCFCQNIMDEKSQADQANECLYHLLGAEDEQEQEAERVDADSNTQVDGILFPSSSSPSTLFDANTFVPAPSKELIQAKTNHIKSTKQVQVQIPESKSNAILPVLFSCKVTCTHYLTYKLQNRYEHYKQLDLDKLDVVLNPTSTLNIQCIFLSKGLENVLDHPPWLRVVLSRVMQRCGFKASSKLTNNNSSTDKKPLYCYQIDKAFVTTPISYVLDKQAPHATLDQIEILFNFTSSKLKEFQANWKRRLTLEIMSDYLDEALTTLLIKRTSQLYPLIFSATYANKLTQSLSYLPHIAQSLQKMYITSRSTMSVTNHAFSESIEEKMELVKKNVGIMNPCKTNPTTATTTTTATTADDDDAITTTIDNMEENAQDTLKAMAQNNYISDELILAMYYALRADISASVKPSTFDPPNALCSIAKLWSITCSKTSYNDDALM